MGRRHREHIRDSRWNLGQVDIVYVAYRLADPIEAGEAERLKARGMTMVGTVFVADDRDKRDLSARRHAAFVVRLVQTSIHALQNSFGHA